MKSLQLAMRLHWSVQKIHGGNGWKEMPAQQQERRLWVGVRAAVTEALGCGNGISKIDREEHLWLRSQWRWLRAGSEVEQGVYVPAGDVRRQWDTFFCFITFLRKKQRARQCWNPQRNWKSIYFLQIMKTKTIRWKLIYFAYLHLECLEFAKTYLRGWLFLDCF